MKLSGTISEKQFVSRLAIFVFYSDDGVVCDYVYYYLSKLGEHVSKLILVSNSRVNDDGMERLDAIADHVILRENDGYDVWAWKAGLEYVGWNKIAEYDEVILANDSVFGPIYDLSEMFAEMSSRDVDFWGVTKCDSQKGDFSRCNPYGYMPDHIQSYFTVYRTKLLQSADLSAYWNELPTISTRYEAIGRHETYFTQHFADKGYRWDVYIRVQDSDKISIESIMHIPEVLLEKYRMPFAKVKLFSKEGLRDTAGEHPRRALGYIRSSTEYDTEFIWDAILRRTHQYDLVKTLSLTYVLPIGCRTGNGAADCNVALVMHLYYPDLLNKAIEIARRFPERCDIWISTDTEEKALSYKIAFSALPNAVTVRVTENRGRSESALLVGMRDIIEKYDFICLWKEKKSEHAGRSVAASWSDKLEQGALASRPYIENVIDLFERNPRLGMLSPLPPIHGNMFSAVGREWKGNYHNTKELLSLLGVDAPMSKKKPPIASLGSVFWFRVKALKPLFDHDWRYADFPEEPIPKNGTLLHALERAYPYIAQSEGYYPAYAVSDDYASLELTNHMHYLRAFNKLAKKYKLGWHNYDNILRSMEKLMKPESLKKHLKRWIKEKF